jgi:hypothetical protein
MIFSIDRKRKKLIRQKKKEEIKKLKEESSGTEIWKK